MKTAQAKDVLLIKFAKWLVVLPMIFALSYSCWDAGRAVYSAWTLDSVVNSVDPKGSPDVLLKYRRSIQKHFINNNVYIPMEDIVIAVGTARLNNLMQDACGKGMIYVWVPIRFRWPIIGEKVFDWCWKN